MKKLIAILTIMIILVGAVFAGSGDKLLVTSKVSEHIPGFKIFGGERATTDGTAAYGTEGTNAGVKVASTKDIALDDIMVDCKISQFSNTTTPEYTGAKAKYKGTATLTITATELVHSTDTTQKASVAASAVSVTGLPAGVTCTPNTTGATVTLPFVYDGRSVQDSAATTMATMLFTWTHSDNLIPGDYSATIKMEYTTGN